MIGRLKGIIVDKQPPQLLLDINGVGYELEAPLSTFYQLPAEGHSVVLHTYFMVREDAQLLYGFHTLQEKQLFGHLIKVNNVGPKLAIAILSGVSTQAFIHSIATNDISRLVDLPGVGKKTAERLIIEMRDRLTDLKPPSCAQADQPQPRTAVHSEAVQGLIALGYKPRQALHVLGKIQGEHGSSAELIKLALQYKDD